VCELYCALVYSIVCCVCIGVPGTVTRSLQLPPPSPPAAVAGGGGGGAARGCLWKYDCLYVAGFFLWLRVWLFCPVISFPGSNGGGGGRQESDMCHVFVLIQKGGARGGWGGGQRGGDGTFYACSHFDEYCFS